MRLGVVLEGGFLRPFGAPRFRHQTHALRHGLHSFAASRLDSRWRLSRHVLTHLLRRNRSHNPPATGHISSSGINVAKPCKPISCPTLNAP